MISLLLIVAAAVAAPAGEHAHAEGWPAPPPAGEHERTEGRPAPPPIVAHSPARLNNSGAFDANTGESSLFVWSGGGPHAGKLVLFETVSVCSPVCCCAPAGALCLPVLPRVCSDATRQINSRYPGMAFGSHVSYYRLRDMDSGAVIVNISESQTLGFGSAFMDHDNKKLWLFGCNRGGKGAMACGGAINASRPRAWEGSVWVLWSTDLLTWHCPALTNVAWSGPNTATARVRGPTHPSLPPHRYVMLTEGLSVAFNNNADGDLTKGWTTLPQCPQAVDPAGNGTVLAPLKPGSNSWAYTTCTKSYCRNVSNVACNRTRLPPLPAAQGLGACPSVKYLPADGFYYVIFAGAPFVYVVRTRDFVTWEQPEQPLLRPSQDDARASPFVGNPATMAAHAPSWWRTVSRWDFNSNDADMCCETWEPSGVVRRALAAREDKQMGWFVWAPSSQGAALAAARAAARAALLVLLVLTGAHGTGLAVLAVQALASSERPLEDVLRSYFPRPRRDNRN